MRRIALLGTLGILTLAGTVFGKELPPPRLEPEHAAKGCEYLGKDYVKVPGSDTCIKIGGSVRVEGTVIRR